MRPQQAILASIILVAATSGLGQSAARRITNAPGAVQVDPDGKLRTSFEIRLAKPGEPFLVNSAEIGGACLLAQYPVTPKSCHDNSDCDMEGYNGHCIPESVQRVVLTPPRGQGSPPARDKPEKGTCWALPTSEESSYCLVGQPVGAYQIGPVDVQPFVQATGVVKWRVLTCLNGTPGACRGEPASTPAMLLAEAGPVRTVPLP